MAFLASTIPSINKSLNRDKNSLQIRKVCTRCGKGFNKRLGRTKAAAVFGQPGRYVCAECVLELLPELAMKSAGQSRKTSS
jgi:DNA-directed RNA polymerase subunit RPC12/RpoP